MAKVQKQNAGLDLGTAGLVIGIIALLVSFIPGLGALGIIPGIIAVILSLVALVQAIKGHGAKKLIIIALVISVLGTVIAGVWSAKMVSVATDEQKTDHNDIITNGKDDDADTTQKNVENMKKLENRLENLEKNPDTLKK